MINRMLITNDLRDDGFGAQYQSIIWTILFAEVKGDTFLYSDIVRMDNDTGDTKKYLEDAIHCMNIKGHYPQVESVGGITMYAPKWPYFYKEIEREMERFHATSSFQKIKSLYYMNKTNPYSSSHTHVAVHIRRPRPFDTRTQGVDTPDEYYVNCMRAVQQMYTSASKPLLFHIFSTGTERAFEVYKQFPCVFHLDESTFETFNKMVYADILITSPSSFSYVAALLTDGIVIYKPFWHPPRKQWLLLN